MRDLFLLISGWVGAWLVWHDRLFTLRNPCLLVPCPLVLSTEILPMSHIFYSYDKLTKTTCARFMSRAVAFLSVLSIPTCIYM